MLFLTDNGQHKPQSVFTTTIP